MRREGENTPQVEAGLQKTEKTNQEQGKKKKKKKVRGEGGSGTTEVKIEEERKGRQKNTMRNKHEKEYRAVKTNQLTAKGKRRNKPKRESGY